MSESDTPVEAPWQSNERLPEAPDAAPYGFANASEFRPCDAQELLSACTNVGEGHPVLVWTPGHRRLVPPFEVPELFEAETQRLRKQHRAELHKGLIVTVLLAAVIVLIMTGDEARREPGGLPPLVQLLMVIGLFFGLLPGAGAIHGLWRLRHRAAKVMADQAVMVRFGIWLGGRQMAFTAGIGTLIVIAFICQSAADYATGGHAVLKAGLVKSAVRDGEVWRMLTCAMVHGGILHIYLNFMAMWSIGRIVEALVDRSYVPLVFLLSVASGSVLSIAMRSEGVSVGASGGILGLIGFVGVLSFRKRGLMPPTLGRSLVLSSVYILAAGLLASDVIDNGAHLGGLLCGVLLGVLLIKRGRPRWPIPGSRFVRVAGILSALILLGTAALAIVMMLL